MNHAPAKDPVSGADWSEYSKFELKWVEIVMTKGVLNRSELLTLLKSFDIRFVTHNWENQTPIAEFGNALLNDAPRAKLLPAIKLIIRERHPRCMSFEEAQTVVASLEPLSIELLRKLFIVVSKPEEQFLVEETTGFQKADLPFLILEYCYRTQSATR
jgi:hypothetical protein